MEVKTFSVFFCANVLILFFSIILYNFGPITKGNKYFGSYIVGENSWDVYDCGRYNSLIDNNDNTIRKNIFKYEKIKCRRHKAMVGLEYTLISLNFIFSIICIILGIILKAESYPEHETQTAFIGIIYSIIGLILTVIYIGFSGYIFNNDSPTYIDYNNINEISDIASFNSVFPKNGIIKINEKGAFAKLNEETNKYELIYPPKDEEDIYACFAKYKDLREKQYNFNKYLYIKKNYDFNFQYCEYNDALAVYAGEVERKWYSDPTNENLLYCNFLYSYQFQENNYNADLYNCWIMTIVLYSIFILFYISILISIKYRS